MVLIPLAAVPNQTFSITLDSNAYDMAVYLANNIMAMDIIRNNEIILMGARLVPDYAVIPYEYLESGNFIITSENGEYPNYTQFGVSQFLYYLSQSELNSLRTGTS